MSTIFQVPTYIIANSEDELVDEMTKVNLEAKAYHVFRDIRQKKDGKWIAWYEVDMRDKLLSKVKPNG